MQQLLKVCRPSRQSIQKSQSKLFSSWKRIWKTHFWPDFSFFPSKNVFLLDDIRAYVRIITAGKKGIWETTKNLIRFFLFNFWTFRHGKQAGQRYRDKRKRRRQVSSSTLAAGILNVCPDQITPSMVMFVTLAGARNGQLKTALTQVQPGHLLRFLPPLKKIVFFPSYLKKENLQNKPTNPAVSFKPRAASLFNSS